MSHSNGDDLSLITEGNGAEDEYSYNPKRSFCSAFMEREDVQLLQQALVEREQALAAATGATQLAQDVANMFCDCETERRGTFLQMYREAAVEVYGHDHHYARTMSEDRPPLQDDEVIALARQSIISAREDTTRRTEADTTEGVAKDLQQPGVTIDLGHHGIRRLPDEVIDIIKHDIERLALSHNQLSTLPLKLTECSRLRYLNVRYNGLREFPNAVLQLSTLEILDVSKNKIREIPEEICNLTSLKVLAIQRNRIERLPLCLGEISSLHMLKLDGNPISFPPPEVCSIKDNAHPSGDNERDAVITTQVKKYLRQATRERLRVESEGDSSESNVETPRPMKIRAGGRFPVKPSISSMDAFADLKPASPGDPPPIPVRSHFRVQSQQSSVARRPPAAPLGNGNERNRSHSEGAGSASIRSKRMGIVTRKGTDLAPLNEARSSIVSHSRDFSYGSTVSDLSSTSQPNGVTHTSAPTSAVDQQRPRLPAIRPLSDVLEHKPWSNDYDRIVHSYKLTAEAAIDFLRPSEKLLRRINVPEQQALMAGLYRIKSSAYTLDNLLDSYEALTEDQEDEADEIFARILEGGDSCLHELAEFEVMLHESADDIVKAVEDFTLRCAWRGQLNAQYMGAVEARNACAMLGISFTESANSKPVNSRQPRASTTPTQTMPHPEQRLRVTHGYNNVPGPASQFGLTPPMPSTSRTNTLSSISSATPRSGESFATLGSVSMSRSNTMQGITDDSDEERIFERIWEKLNTACKLTLKTLPACHMKFDQARHSARHERVISRWILVLEHSKAVHDKVAHLDRLVSGVKLRDAEFRGSEGFWVHCTAYVKAWSDLAMTVKEIAQMGQLPEDIKQAMKPIQKAVKEASVAITASPWSHLAVRNESTYSQQMPPMHPVNRSIGHSFGGSSTSSLPGPINTSIASISNYTHVGLPPTSSGYVTPVPATPLTAALGAAAQATVPSTPSRAPTPVDQSAPLTGRFAGNVFERADRLLQQTQRRV